MVDVLAQFVDNVPQPLTDALVNLAPLLAVAACGARLLAWSDDWHASWVTLAAWWFFCLAAPVLFRYALPILFAIAVIWVRRRRQIAPIVTETVLQNAIADFTALRNILPPAPTVSLPPIAILRAAGILTLPWLALSYLFSPQLLLALIGTLAFTHRAPWARILRSVLWRSAFVRTSLRRIHSFLTGQLLPKHDVSSQPTSTMLDPVPSLRFLFTVYENQRWWMGLDWTAALLPAERPSWCSPSLHPVSPPNAFTLPDPTTVYLPSPDRKSRIKRTAIWKWDEPEWRLLVRKEGSSLSRIERAPPSPDDPSPLTLPASTSSGTRLFKAAANKLKDSSLSSPPRSSPPADSDTAPPHPSTDQDDPLGESFTDPDGWIFGDNKWENQSHRGGLGKYTRYRRWTRVAIVGEVVEVVEPGALGVQNTTIPVASETAPNTPTKVDSDSEVPLPGSPTPSSPTTTALTSEMESPLRQRLRAALSKASLPPSSS